MKIIDVDTTVDTAIAEEFRVVRRDLLEEHSNADGTVFEQETGPFSHYRRSLTIERIDDERSRVVERTEFTLGVPIWSWLFNPLMKRALAEPDRSPRRRWWWPRQVLPLPSARLLASLSILSILAGYLGVLIGQTITFAAEEFGANDAAQGRTLAAVRIGVIASVIVIRRADRIGRRPLLIGFTLTAIVFTVLGAAAQSLVQLAVLQGISRGFTTGLFTLLTLAVTEEVPAEVRAVGISLMAMCSGLGAGMVLWVLPLADTGPGGWRWAYVAPAIFLLPLFWVFRTLPETRRFTRADETHSPAPVDRRRFTLIAFSAFASALFLSPASQLFNEYLRDERMWSASDISIYRLLTGTPTGLVILGAGVLADRVGRKPIGGIGLFLGAIGGASVYFLDGAALWIAGTAGAWLLASAFPALRGYQTELFPTRSRARVGGWIDLITVTGSAIGLLTAGELSLRWGSLGPAISVLLVGPLIVAVLIFTIYPETAAQELETFNPDDPRLV